MVPESGSQLGMDRRTGLLSTGKRVSLFDVFCIAEASVCVWIVISMSFCVIVLTGVFAVNNTSLLFPILGDTLWI